MTGSDLAALLAKKRQTSLGQAKLMVDVIFDCLKDSLCRGERIGFRGLGTFRVRSYKSYLGHNPKTGEVIQVKPKRLPFFKPSVALLWEMNRRLRDSSAKRAENAGSSGPSLSGSPREPPGPYEAA